MTDIVDAPNDIDADNELVAGENSAEESQMTDILRDYTRSMTRMHDEMIIGMGYNLIQPLLKRCLDTTAVP
ncbi:hypothetical protein [Psychrobacter sp. WY6]|uniref:hypothetical protein n=1 Tax=Psychrobacter sp. WY6 TaxID=2708350 RepID=UPI002022D8A1|nr:hypothetical protein [Psychrobacter sp. WY6]